MGLTFSTNIENSLVDLILYSDNNERIIEIIDQNPELLNKLLKCELGYKMGYNSPLTGLNFCSPLMLASIYGKETLAKVLIEKGANVDLQDDDGGTALMMACQYSNTDIVRLLIEHEANIELQDKRGRTALMRACECRSVDIVRLLIEHEVNLDLQDDDGRTALMRACEYSDADDSVDIVQLLIEDGANLNLQDNDGLIAYNFIPKSPLITKIKIKKIFKNACN